MTLPSNATIRQVALLIPLLVMGAVSYLAATFDTFPGDAGGIEKFQSFRNSWLDYAARVASYSANTPVAVSSIVAVSVALWLGRRRADALVVLLVFIPEGVNLGLKELVGRPRPEFSLLASPPENPAFPSGHAIHALLLFGLLMLILGELIKPLWLRTGIQGLLGFMILACGASKVYLGVHWPSDVLGAYLLGGFFIVVLLWVRKKLFYWGLQ